MKLNIKTKLIGGFLVVVGLMVLVGVIGWNGLIPILNKEGRERVGGWCMLHLIKCKGR